MAHKSTEIVIIGAGMAGLSLAALLAQRGVDVAVIDREDPVKMATENFDARTIALSVGSRNVLAPLGIWDDMVRHAAPIEAIDVQEGHDPFLLNFQAQDVNHDAFGWIFPNTVVRGTLYETAVKHGVKFYAPDGLKDYVADEKGVTATLQSGMIVAAQLLIGADGRMSRVRELTGVAGVSLPYHQAAWVGFVEHEMPHHGLAVERFYDTGPFAILPYTTQNNVHRSAIVWTHDLPKKNGKYAANLAVPDLVTLTTELKPLFDSRYGDIQAVGKWASYPLSLYHAKEFVAPRVALISDAAHAIHPIAGQGLNLGMRDVAVLVELLAGAKQNGDDLGAMDLLETYQQKRRFDVFAMVAATDVLNRLFGTKLKSVRWARSFGLGLVDRVKPLKRFFMNVASGQ